jgi:VanZ family protein
LALFVVLFTLYGSYVPFQWNQVHFATAVEQFPETVLQGLWPTSKSDWVANVILGMPLGFSLMGWWQARRSPSASPGLLGLAVLPICAFFSAGVEFGQLFVVGRTCAGSDIMAQSIGAAAGIVLWIWRGPWLTRVLEEAFFHPAVASGPIRLLTIYLGLFALIEWLPLDINVSPRAIYHRFKEGSVTWDPFSEVTPRLEDERSVWPPLASWCELLLLALPVGVLLTLSGTRRVSLAQAWLGGLLLGLILELGQIPVMSRHPSISDVLIIQLGVSLGWLLGMGLALPGSRKYKWEWVVVVGQVWLFGLIVIHWQPFDFDLRMRWSNFARMSWLPLSGQTEKNYLWALNEILTKLVLYIPLGALFLWPMSRNERASSVWLVAGLVAGIATILELGQIASRTRLTSPSDVLFGLVGGAIGAGLMRRVAVDRLREEMKVIPWWTQDPIPRIGASVPRH